ncbi:molecular chaperone GrpE [Mycobacteroides chelonae]|nr:molecular chaperone GrpE [Mycobacteroides chelonae]
MTVTDRRRIDPNTGAVREEAKAAEKNAAAAEPGASAPGAAASEGDSDADAKVAELTADLQRAHADFANYRKRVERDRQVVIDSAKASVVAQLLGVLDDLERAREHGDLESGPLRSVSDKLTAALEGLGLATFGTEGDDFDPSLHEAVQHDGQDGHPVLAAVLRKGYKMGDRVLRTAMVVVTDGNAKPEAGDTAQQEPETGSESQDAETQSKTESE